MTMKEQMGIRIVLTILILGLLAVLAINPLRAHAALRFSSMKPYGMPTTITAPIAPVRWDVHVFLRSVFIKAN